MRKQNSKKSVGTFQKNLTIMTNQMIASMCILDSDPKKHSIRFLHDPKSGLYVVFNGRLNASHYAKSYQMAERYYKHLVSISQ